MRTLIMILVAGTALSGASAYADNPRCMGASDTYEGSKSGCRDARHPRDSKYNKKADSDDKPTEPVERQPEVKPVEVKPDGTIVL